MRFKELNTMGDLHFVKRDIRAVVPEAFFMEAEYGWVVIAGVVGSPRTYFVSWLGEATKDTHCVICDQGVQDVINGLRSDVTERDNRP